MKNIIAKILLISSVSLLLPFNITHSENIKKIEDICISKNEHRLLNLINSFRIENNLKEISLSASLTFIAKLHINDLITNRPDTSICNLHSWSDKGNWKSCCYNKYVYDQSCMINKAKELTKYKANAYELVFHDSFDTHPDSIFNSWSNNFAFADMLLSRNKWANYTWKSIGIAIKGEYAAIWFGEVKDFEEKPDLCNKASIVYETKEVDKQEEIKFITEKTNKYYVIFGSVKNQKDAEIKLSQYRKNNFPDAVVMVKDKKFRICLSTHNTLKEARTAREALGEGFKDAWILKF